MRKINLNKHIYEGWIVKDFIDKLAPILAEVMKSNSYIKPITNRKQLIEWVGNNQPYIKKPIPEVIDYFTNLYNIN